MGIGNGDQESQKGSAGLDQNAPMREWTHQSLKATKTQTETMKSNLNPISLLALRANRDFAQPRYTVESTI